MDEELIPVISTLWRDGYYDKIPSAQFYRLLLEVIPQTNKKVFWFKKENKANQKVLEYIAKWYSVSMREASDYYRLFISNDDGLKELIWILEGNGLTEKEQEELLTQDSNL